MKNSNLKQLIRTLSAYVFLSLTVFFVLIGSVVAQPSFQKSTCSYSGGDTHVFYFGNFRENPGECLLNGTGVKLLFYQIKGLPHFLSMVLYENSQLIEYNTILTWNPTGGSTKIEVRQSNGSIQNLDLESLPPWGASVLNQSDDLLRKFVPEAAAAWGAITAKRQAEVNKVEQAQRQKEMEKTAAETALFRSDLAKMNAGQLFAKADELGAQGDTAKARETLRMLISKFPDHPLAATAAQQLATMSAASANANAAQSSNASSGSGSSGGSASGSKAGVLLSCNDSIEPYLKTLPNFSASGLRGIVNSLRIDGNSLLAGAKAGRLKASDIQGLQQQMQDYKNSGRTALENHDKLSSSGRSAAMCNPPENSMAFAWAATQMGVAFNTWAINVIRCTAGQTNPEPIPAFCPF